MANVFIEYTDRDVISLVNGTGADLIAKDFTVIAPYVCVAQEPVLSTKAGWFVVKDGIVIQTKDLHATENTFATLQQIVYFDPATKTVSDTSGATYFPVGYLSAVKDSGGMIKFEKSRFTAVVGA